MEAARPYAVHIFKAIIAVVFVGMSAMFWFVNRKEDIRRVEEMNRLDAEEAAGGGRQLTPLQQLQRDLSAALRCSEDMNDRGDLLVDVMNRLFELGDVSVTRKFVRNGHQINGVITKDENRYWVDVRWEDRAVGVAEIQKHLDQRDDDDATDAAIGLFVSFCGFTESAIEAARNACKSGDAMVLCTLADFVHVLEGQGNIDAFLATRVQIAVTDKNPYASYR